MKKEKEIELAIRLVEVFIPLLKDSDIKYCVECFNQDNRKVKADFVVGGVSACEKHCKIDIGYKEKDKLK